MTGDQFSEVDLDLLADYVGGALEGTPEEATVARRVADDPAWRAAHDELSAAMSAVGSRLSAWGAASEPMPADVAARVDAALTAAPPPMTVISGDRDDHQAGPVRRRPRWAAPLTVAAAVLLFAGVGGGILVNRAQTANDSGITSSAGSADKSAPFMAPSVALPPADRIRSSGTDYETGTLGKPVPQPLRDTKGESADSSGFADPLTRLRGSDALQDCLAAIASANGLNSLTVDSVDYARYAGKPALIVVFTSDNGRFAWASGPDCGAPGAGADRLASVPVG